MVEPAGVRAGRQLGNIFGKLDISSRRQLRP
jgi:hypothetical protein